MQKSARTHRANVRGQEWVDKRRRAEEKWEEKLIIYSPQVLAHYWDCAVLFTICKTLTEPLAAAARPSSQGQTQTQLCSQTTVCPPTPVNPLGEWTLPLHFATSCIIYADAYHHMQDFIPHDGAKCIFIMKHAVLFPLFLLRRTDSWFTPSHFLIALLILSSPNIFQIFIIEAVAHWRHMLSYFHQCRH